MKKFEYWKTNQPNTFHLHEDSFQNWLNRKGQEGWELVGIIQNPFVINNGCVANYDIYFKREIK